MISPRFDLRAGAAAAGVGAIGEGAGGTGTGAAYGEGTLVIGPGAFGKLYAVALRWAYGAIPIAAADGTCGCAGGTCAGGGAAMYAPGGAEGVRFPRPANEPGVAGANVGIAGWCTDACASCCGDNGLKRSQCHALRSGIQRAVVPHAMLGGAFTT